MSEPTNQVQKVSKSDREVAFIPFGAESQIRLSIAIVQNLCCEPTKSGRTCSERDALRFMMLCQAKRLNPFEGDCYLVGYDTKQPDGSYAPKYSQITAHQVFLKRAEVHPEFDGMESGIILLREDKTIEERQGDFHLRDEVVVGGWAKVYYKHRKYPMYRRASLELYRQDNRFWNNNPAMMVCKIAEADSLRAAFPTQVGGLFLGEEVSFPTNIVISNGAELAKPKFDRAMDVSNLEPQKQITQTEPSPDPAMASEAEVGTSATAPSHPKDPEGIQTCHQRLEAWMKQNQISPLELTDYLGKSKRLKDADSLSSLEEIPAKLVRAILTEDKAVVQAIKGELV